MTSEVETSSPENRFTGRLTRKARYILLPSILLPGFIVVMDLLVFSKLVIWGRITGIVGTSLFLGLVIAFTLKRFINKQIIDPVEKVIETVRRFSLGDLKERCRIERNDEMGLLAHLIDNVGGFLYDRLYSLEIEVNKRDFQLRLKSELGEILSTVEDWEQILQRSVDLIVDRFNYKRASIYLLNGNVDQAVLKADSRPVPKFQIREEETIPVKAESTLDWVVRNNKPKIFSDPKFEGLALPASASMDTKSVLAIPISIEENVLGILLVQDRKEGAFGHDDVAILSTIADQIAPYIHDRYHKGAVSIFPDQTFLYNASHTIITAESKEQVLAAIRNSLKQMPYATALFYEQQNRFLPLFVTDRSGYELSKNAIDDITIPSFSSTTLTSIPTPITISRPEVLEGLPAPLVSISQKLQFDSLILYPLAVNERLSGLLFMGSTENGEFSPANREAIQRLVDITITSLDKVNALQTSTSHLTELRTLNTISQSLSSETHLEKLYEVVHQQIINVMGPVNFLIALYAESSSTIEIPYMDDGDQIISVPPFPLGQGLTSIIIRTRQPLMIVEDTANRSRALGAIVTGDQPALSWLGVPMIIRDEIIGAIVVQDLEQEHRFDENDMRLLTTLAAQIAIAVRNTRLIETVQKRSVSDRQLYEITNKIRRQIDIQGILSTTAQELSKVLSIRSTRLTISPELMDRVINGNSGTKGDVSYSFENKNFETIREEPLETIEKPLILRDQVIGQIILEGDSRSLDSEDETFIESVATQAALALENVRLMEATQRSAHHNRVVAELSHKVWESTDMDTILQTTLYELAEALQASNGLIRLEIPQESDESLPTQR
jgi:GAF domain-containing protein/HAMP domain-containing protein